MLMLRLPESPRRWPRTTPTPHHHELRIRIHRVLSLTVGYRYWSRRLCHIENAIDNKISDYSSLAWLEVGVVAIIIYISSLRHWFNSNTKSTFWHGNEMWSFIQGHIHCLFQWLSMQRNLVPRQHDHSQ